jgi:hypothetical protein
MAQTQVKEAEKTQVVEKEEGCGCGCEHQKAQAPKDAEKEQCSEEKSSCCG